MKVICFDPQSLRNMRMGDTYTLDHPTVEASVTHTVGGYCVRGRGVTLLASSAASAWLQAETLIQSQEVAA